MNATPRQEPADLNDPALRARAVTAARGDAPFDVLITGGRLLDAVTGLIREADVGLVGALISSVHAPASRTDAIETIDASCRILTPCLIDTH
ncbi:MAG: adenine deaminase, partial [Rhizobium leguminosarum]|nr:adenine deaminase [Rhizobium leguminosarum]